MRLWQKAYLPTAGDDLHRSGRAALSASVRRRSGGRCRCPRRRLSAIKAAAAVWDQFGNVVVKLGQCLVECGEPGPMCSRELCQVGVGYLAVADDSLGRLAFPDEQPHQATLGDWAGGEAPGHAHEPVLGGLMMDMIID